MKIRLSELKQLIREAYEEVHHGDGAEEDLKFDKKSVLVPFDIKDKIKKYFRDMRLVKSKKKRR
jgi:hypothetical protein